MNRCLLAIASFLCIASASLSACTPAYVVPAAVSAPSGTVSPSLSSISFSSTTPQTFTVSEVGYSGSFTAVSAEVSVATVAQTSSKTDARRRDATTTTTFTVTPVGGGTTTIVVSDQDGHSASISVSVTSATITPSRTLKEQSPR
jgi:hypothetical protein